MPPDGSPLKLTDFVDAAILQEIQDAFAAVASVRAAIFDADGQPLTQPTPSREFLARQRSIAETEARLEGPQKEGREYVAPIQIGRHRFGTIRMKPLGGADIDEGKLAHIAEKFALDLKQIRSINGSLARLKDNRPAAIQFLYLLANAIARLGHQEYQLRQRVDELTAVYNVATMLAESRDLQTLLQRTAEVVASVMQVKASSIRLLARDSDDLVIGAVHNLSPQYVAKGPIRLSESPIDQEALSGQGFASVANLAVDQRAVYPQDAAREGIVSELSAGMRYKGRPVGVIRVYTDREQAFAPIRIALLRSIAAQAAAAIENARLLEESIARAALEKQVQMAASVQRRLLPKEPPHVEGIDLSAIYVPSYALGGDFYDFIRFPDDNVGIVVADVSGKGIPASLIMASVRSALRAQVDNLYYLYEAMSRVNLMLCRDSEPTEFVTLFYGVLDGRNGRLTYCSAGHPPGLLLRQGKVTELDSANLVLGVNPEEQFQQSILDLRSGDALLFYTDGLFDAVAPTGERFGRARIAEVFARHGDSPAGAIAHGILWEMRKFVGIAKPTDDVTMVVAKAE